MATYHADVEFLENCSPALIERNAAEFARLRDLLMSVETSVIKAKNGTIWESVHRAQYDTRLADVRHLVTTLAEGFGAARTALLAYADEVERAQRYLGAGVAAETTLDGLVSSVAHPVTRTAQQAEPMRRWEDIRETTGFLDSLAEWGMDVDAIRDQATRAYEEADDAFSRAQSIERAARQECLIKLTAAHAALPDFRGGDFTDAVTIIGSITPLLNEAGQARDDPLAHLPGSGAKSAIPVAGVAAVSSALQHIRDLLRSLPAARGGWFHDVAPGGKTDWIRNNRELIYAAAAKNGLPLELIAGIAWKEVGGKPYIIDNIAERARRFAESGWSPVTPEGLPRRLGGDPDDTSYGPLAVQLRRGAEVLGYDPGNLSELQRDEIRSALDDPAQNLFIASKYLANLKAESEFADVPPDDLTLAQYQELAARYNGGPNWQGDQAQGYGRDFTAHLDEARAALR